MGAAPLVEGHDPAGAAKIEKADGINPPAFPLYVGKTSYIAYFFHLLDIFFILIFFIDLDFVPGFFFAWASRTGNFWGTHQFCDHVKIVTSTDARLQDQSVQDA